MKSLSVIVLLFYILQSPLQAQLTDDFKAIDKHAKKAPRNIQTDIKALSAYLVEPATTELEKARSIYTWITHNISYDKFAYKEGQNRINKNNRDVLTRRMAVCFGYSTLFREMCSFAGLQSEVISGYSKGTLTAKPKLEEPDHAWNAIQIDGQWHLLDATWGSSLIDKTNDFVLAFQEGYFLTSPERFIVNHLPANPMWQLLNCPVLPEVFQKPAEVIIQQVESSEKCFHYQDSILQFQALSEDEKILKEAQAAYQFHPTATNKKLLGHAHFDFATKQSDLAEELQANQAFDELIEIQADMLYHCRKAAKYTTLYNWQQEFFINTLINRAVALSKTLDQLESAVAQLKQYEEVLVNLNEASEQIDQLPESTFKAYARQSCDTFLAITKENMALLKTDK